MARGPLAPPRASKPRLEPDLLGNIGEDKAGHSADLAIAALAIELLSARIEITDHQEQVAGGLGEVHFRLIEQSGTDTAALRGRRDGDQTQIRRAAKT